QHIILIKWMGEYIMSTQNNKSENALVNHNHRMRKFTVSNHEDKQILTSACIHCGMKMVITHTPAKTFLAGDATVQPCPYAKPEQ
ncbi:MAG TPA: hypothetical protein VN611_13515, partial [Patescibacteria group bacterium]|nr:hypothetical protein [Patescibacteria group bacterium]